MKIVSLDPGTTTGVIIYDTEETRIRHTQLGPTSHHLRLFDLLRAAHPEVVVCESFEFRPNPGRRKVVLDSKEYIGIAKLYCRMNNADYVEQQPNQGKNFWTDDKIKKLGLWVPGQKHAMDALRHMLYYLVFVVGKRDILERLK